MVFYEMNPLGVTEIKAFVPAKHFELSKQFYKNLGFTMASEGGGVAYFLSLRSREFLASGLLH
jgi:hypothetical protein